MEFSKIIAFNFQASCAAVVAASLVNERDLKFSVRNGESGIVLSGEVYEICETQV